MPFFAFLLVAVALWLLWTGRLQRMTGTDGVILGLGIVGAIMASHGNMLFGGGVMAVAAIYAGKRSSAKYSTSARNGTSGAEPPAVAEARSLLGLSEEYDAEAVREAHRRLIIKVHPDAGGTSALAEKINDARDVLLRHHATKQNREDSPPL